MAPSLGWGARRKGSSMGKSQASIGHLEILSAFERSNYICDVRVFMKLLKSGNYIWVEDLNFMNHLHIGGKVFSDDEIA